MTWLFALITALFAMLTASAPASTAPTIYAHVAATAPAATARPAARPVAPTAKPVAPVAPAQPAGDPVAQQLNDPWPLQPVAARCAAFPVPPSPYVVAPSVKVSAWKVAVLAGTPGVTVTAEGSTVVPGQTLNVGGYYGQWEFVQVDASCQHFGWVRDNTLVPTCTSPSWAGWTAAQAANCTAGAPTAHLAPVGGSSTVLYGLYWSGSDVYPFESVRDVLPSGAVLYALNGRHFQ